MIVSNFYSMFFIGFVKGCCERPPPPPLLRPLILIRGGLAGQRLSPPGRTGRPPRLNFYTSGMSRYLQNIIREMRHPADFFREPLKSSFDGFSSRIIAHRILKIMAREEAPRVFSKLTKKSRNLRWNKSRDLRVPAFYISIMGGIRKTIIRGDEAAVYHLYRFLAILYG